MRKGRVGFVFMWGSGIGVSMLVLCIFIFLCRDALAFFDQYSFFEFLSGKVWRPEADVYGLAPMLFGSLITTLLALLIALPIGVFAVLAMQYYCGKRLRSAIEFFINVAAGIPSVVYGLFGLILLCPLTAKWVGGAGFSALSASVLLAIMILPTVMSLYYAEVASVVPEYYACALALGESSEKSIIKCVLPKTAYGILSAAILAVGRAIGETMAVLMVAGNISKINFDLTQGIRTLTTNIALEMGYASGTHRLALIASGFVLLCVVLLLEFVLYFLKRKMADE